MAQEANPQEQITPQQVAEYFSYKNLSNVFKEKPNNQNYQDQNLAIGPHIDRTNPLSRGFVFAGKKENAKTSFGKA